jgi:hypothetical protein
MHCELPSQEGQQYCQHISGGFTGSSKINAVVDWLRTKVLEGDKVIVLSFSKEDWIYWRASFAMTLVSIVLGSMGTLTVRLLLPSWSDSRETRLQDTPCEGSKWRCGIKYRRCKPLFFLDRWYNPFVHKQAEDRCHRIGQTKDVNVVYFDCAAWVDEVMVQVNKRKQENSVVLLADGFEIGQQQGLSYNDLPGLLGNLLAVVRSHRTGWLEADPEHENLPIPPMPADLIANALAGNLARVTTTKSSDDKEEETKKKNIFAGSTGLEDFIVNDSDVEEVESDG